MKQSRGLIKLLIELFLIGGGIAIIIGLINFIPARQEPFSALQQNYPAPGTQATTRASRLETAYPPPVELTKVPLITSTAKATPTPRVFSDPAEATKYTWMMSHTSSPSEIAARATSAAEKKQPYTPPASPTPFLFLLNSPTEIISGALSEPSLKKSANLQKCLRNENSRNLELIHALNAQPDYIAIPFYQNDQLCSLVLVKILGGMGTIAGWSESTGGQFPGIDSNQARTMVEVKTGVKLSSMPRLVYGKFRECPDPFSPMWETTTVEGNKYYIITRAGKNEEGKFEFSINILVESEMHLLN